MMVMIFRFLTWVLGGILAIIGGVSALGWMLHTSIELPIIVFVTLLTSFMVGYVTCMASTFIFGGGDHAGFVKETTSTKNNDDGVYDVEPGGIILPTEQKPKKNNEPLEEEL